MSQHPTDSPRFALTRRRALAGLAAAALWPATGCSSTGSRRASAAATPGPRWPDLPARDPAPHSAPASPGPGAPHTAFTGVHRRSEWASGAPIPRRMDRMKPVRRLTVHHDGMPPVSLTSPRDVAARIDLIRKSHLRRGWGDIGYHYIVDPMGVVWEGRPLTWQGAHVAHQNPGNLGVLALGNFQVQQPTPAQLATIDRFVASRMGVYHLNIAGVYTHQELAPTECPGRALQRHMTATRRPTGRLAAMAHATHSLG